MILTVSGLLFPLATYTYASRILMPEGIGQASFASSVVSYFSMFAHLGIPTYGIRACAAVRGDRNALSKTVQELVIINICTAMISMTALLVCMMTVPRLIELRTLIMIYSVGFLASILEMAWLFSALEDYAYITKRAIALKCLSLAAVFVFIRTKEDVPAYAAIAVASAILTSLINVWYARNFISFKPARNYDLCRHLKPVLVFFMMSVATTVYLNLDTVMLGFMTNDTQVGLYNSAVKLKTVLTGVITSLGTVLLPRMSRLAAEGEEKSFKEYASKGMNYIFVLSVPLVIYFICFAKESILVLSGTEFTGAVPSMRIIMPTLLLIGITNILGVQIMIPRGREKAVLFSEICGAAADVIFNAVFIPTMGAAGAALGTLIAEFTVLLVQLYFLRYELKEIFQMVSRTKLFSADIAFIASVLLCKYFMSGRAIVVLVMSSAICFVIYALLLLAFKESLTVDAVKYFIGLFTKECRKNDR